MPRVCYGNISPFVPHNTSGVHRDLIFIISDISNITLHRPHTMHSASSESPSRRELSQNTRLYKDPFGNTDVNRDAPAM